MTDLYSSFIHSSYKPDFRFTKFLCVAASTHKAEKKKISTDSPTIKAASANVVATEGIACDDDDEGKLFNTKTSASAKPLTNPNAATTPPFNCKSNAFSRHAYL